MIERSRSYSSILWPTTSLFLLSDLSRCPWFSKIPKHFSSIYHSSQDESIYLYHFGSALGALYSCAERESFRLWRYSVSAVPGMFVHFANEYNSLTIALILEIVHML